MIQDLEKKNGGKDWEDIRNVYQRPRRTKEQIEMNNTLEGNNTHTHDSFMEKEMAAYCSILAGKIPQTEKPGGLPSMGSQRIRHI